MSLLTPLVALHVLAAAFWVGSVVFLTGFVVPAVARSGEAGGIFMGRLLAVSRFPVAFAIAGATTVLSGGWLFWIVSDGLQPAFMRSPMGMLISAGALCGIAAMVAGIAQSRARDPRLGMLASALLVAALVLMTLGAHI